MDAHKILMHEVDRDRVGVVDRLLPFYGLGQRRQDFSRPLSDPRPGR
jgi:hypothetical protein